MSNWLPRFLDKNQSTTNLGLASICRSQHQQKEEEINSWSAEINHPRTLPNVLDGSHPFAFWTLLLPVSAGGFRCKGSSINSTVPLIEIFRKRRGDEGAELEFDMKRAMLSGEACFIRQIYAWDTFLGLWACVWDVYCINMVGPMSLPLVIVNWSCAQSTKTFVPWYNNQVSRIKVLRSISEGLESLELMSSLNSAW